MALLHLNLITSAFDKVKYPYGNLEVSVNLRNFFFWRSLKRKKWEPKLIQYLFNLSIKTQTIFDVGAWIGPTAILFSYLVEPNGRIEAFEPVSETFKLLVSNIHSNNLANVHPRNLAISNVEGEVRLLSPTKLSTSASMIRYKNSNDG